MNKNDNMKYKYTITITGEETLYNSFIERYLKDRAITREELFNNNNRLLDQAIEDCIKALITTGIIKITDYANLEYEIIE